MPGGILFFSVGRRPISSRIRRMRLERFQKLALAALVSVVFLVFVGAVVRVSGAGLGCPDWPHCWGCWIPPTKVSDVDFSKVPIEKFKKNAERHGRDPDTITIESLKKEFNPRHVWTEYINRLCSMPVGFFSLATFIAAFWQREKRPWVFWSSFSALVLVIFSAWLGKKVVESGLKPGVITAHLAMAMGVLVALVYAAWRGCEKPWSVSFRQGKGTGVKIAVVVLFVCTLVEAIMGSQLREITDVLAKSHLEQPRSEWIGELEQTLIYFVHRSFSWSLLVMVVLAYWWSKRDLAGKVGRVEDWVLALVLCQMVLGVVMSRIQIFAGVQVLHVGLSSILIVLEMLWLCGLFQPTVLKEER